MFLEKRLYVAKAISGGFKVPKVKAVEAHKGEIVYLVGLALLKVRKAFFEFGLSNQILIGCFVITYFMAKLCQPYEKFAFGTAIIGRFQLILIVFE